LTQKLYEFRLNDIEVIYSKKSIYPWQGALLWSYEKKGDEPFPVIQIRKKGILNEEEILAHELVHAARFAFKEPFFEEMLAYQTSSNKFYKILGPLFLFQIEPLLFLLLSFISFLGVIYLEKLYLLWLPLLAFAILCLRLTLLHSLFFLARKNLKKEGALNPLAVLLRLSDREIIQSALFSPKKILQKKKKDLRLQEILPNYIPFT
ncbi:MAG: hypothetical protein JSS09_05505, partial [Verrucomicrobia bacterium]|nr:hypothetical protein [Verrucomicrobiota bacterium]